MSKIPKFVFGKFLYTALFVALQIAVIVWAFVYFNERFAFFYAFNVVLSLAVLLHLIYKNSNPEYKLAWVIPILIFPIFGGFLYVVFTHNRSTEKMKKMVRKIDNTFSRSLKSENQVGRQLKAQNADAYLQSQYISNTTHSVISNNTETKYLPTGEAFFESVLDDLKNAKKFIFLEYFIIEQGVMWDSIYEILKQKVKQGIEVRVMYDDFGCMFKLPQNFSRQLEKDGIKVHVFHKFTNILSPTFNNRDHRKILVIDGIVGYCGGINLADEYINVKKPFGHWKDTAVRLYGGAVFNLTMMFLSIWDCMKNEKTDNYLTYAPSKEIVENIKSDGFVHPYSDIPLDEFEVSKSVYINMINKAKKYIYITTPYLIIDNTLIEALTLAALNGVDVRIITPYIPDHKYVHMITRSYYDVLIKSGVKIYEYTPGFIHSKTFVCDDEYAIVGTVNLDFRSLYLHYECAVWFYKSSVVGQVYDDILETMKASQRIESVKRKSLIVRIVISILKAFAPLL